MANPPPDYYSHDPLGLDPDDPRAAEDLREWLKKEGVIPLPSDEEIQELLRRLRSTRNLLGIR
jgi:hypothetical protein